MNWLDGWCIAEMEGVFGEALSQGNAPHQSGWLKVLAELKQTPHCEGLALKVQSILQKFSSQNLFKLLAICISTNN